MLTLENIKFSTFPYVFVLLGYSELLYNEHFFRADGVFVITEPDCICWPGTVSIYCHHFFRWCQQKIMPWTDLIFCWFLLRMFTEEIMKCHVQIVSLLFVSEYKNREKAQIHNRLIQFHKKIQFYKRFDPHKLFPVRCIALYTLAQL